MSATRTAVAVITGSAGLVGSESARFFSQRGMDVVGIDNDMRKVFFGHQASTLPTRERLQRELGAKYRHVDADIRDVAAVESVFERYGRDIDVVIHAAAQPSHDWATRDPFTDFSVNAIGTSILLEATRKHAPNAVFLFLSTNKVYGDTPNRLPLREQENRWEIEPGHRYADGIGEDMSIDQSLHSLFGASKLAADVLVQEYGNYFGLQTACFRGGCLTGPNHAGAELHGFLAYLLKCTVTGTPYTVYGYKGKQVRDNIHSEDLVRAFATFLEAPRAGEVYNIGGGRLSHCSMLEAIKMCEELAGRPLQWTYAEENRRGDHVWWISDNRKFRNQYPAWQQKFAVDGILDHIYSENVERWRQERHS